MKIDCTKWLINLSVFVSLRKRTYLANSSSFASSSVSEPRGLPLGVEPLLLNVTLLLSSLSDLVNFEAVPCESWTLCNEDNKIKNNGRTQTTRIRLKSLDIIVLFYYLFYDRANFQSVAENEVTTRK